MHMWPPYMHLKYLVILTCSFKMAAILVFFFDFAIMPMYTVIETSYHTYLSISSLQKE